MKIAFAAAASLTTFVFAEANYIPDPAKAHQVLDPIMAPDLRLRLPNGRLRPDLSPGGPKYGPLATEAPPLRAPQSPSPRPLNSSSPQPITPLGDGEFPAMPVAPNRDPRFPVPMPTTQGKLVPPLMPMAMPDPAIDYKLHVLEMTPASGGDAKK